MLSIDIEICYTANKEKKTPANDVFSTLWNPLIDFQMTK